MYSFPSGSKGHDTDGSNGDGGDEGDNDGEIYDQEGSSEGYEEDEDHSNSSHNIDIDIEIDGEEGPEDEIVGLMPEGLVHNGGTVPLHLESTSIGIRQDAQMTV